MPTTRSLRRLIAGFGIAVVLSGCTAEGKYPLTGKDCDPEDPVLSMDAGDCAAGTAGSLSGSF